MGLYINPYSGEDKALWLQRNAKHFARPPNEHEYNALRNNKETVVCLIDNIVFTSAGVCYSYDELKAFAGDSSDRRKKTWFVIGIKKLIEEDVGISLDNLTSYGLV